MSFDTDETMISRAQLLARGMSDTAIRRARERGELTTVLPGLYRRTSAGDRPDAAERHRAALTVILPRLAGRPVVSHVSAAIVHGLPFCHSELPPLHVTRPNAATSRRGVAVELHTGALRPDEVVRLGGLEVTSVERTVVDCAVTMPFDHAVGVADAALRRGLASRTSLERQLARHPRVPGTRRAAAVVAFADPRSAGPGESYSRVLLHRWGFPPPDLDPEPGPTVGRVAFGFPRSRVLGAFEEPDGHRGGGGVARDAALRDAGWRLVRWWWPDLRAPQPWVERLADALGIRDLRPVPGPAGSIP